MATNEQDELREKICNFLEAEFCDSCRDVGMPKHATDKLMAMIAQHTKEAERAKMVELRDQWGVWLDDSADDKQIIREIYDWLNREIDFFDKEHYGQS